MPGILRVLSAPFVLLFCLMIQAASPFVPVSDKGTAEWKYENLDGPSFWGDLSHKYKDCNGPSQSPINLTGAVAQVGPALGFDYHETRVSISNNCHTIKASFKEENRLWLTIGEKRYYLDQFHFHYKSEHRLENKTFPMEVHLVHVGDDGKLAVVGVFLEEGEPNKLVAELWSKMPRDCDSGQPDPGAVINPAALLPANGSYLTYSGSLTTPPCDEIVTWYVMQQPITLSAEQINAFKKLYPNNARPIQQINGRPVYSVNQ